MESEMPLVRDVMQENVVTATPETPVSGLVELLERERISGVPVVGDDGRLLGVVSMRDVIRLARELEAVPEARRWGLAITGPAREAVFLDAPVEGEFFAYYVTPQGTFVDVRDRIRELPGGVFEGYMAEDIMTPAPVTIGPDAPLRELAALLRRGPVHRALVVDAGRLMGIVTTMDVLSAVAGE
jgi:CBS domain-containing protein